MFSQFRCTQNTIFSISNNRVVWISSVNFKTGLVWSLSTRNHSADDVSFLPKLAHDSLSILPHHILLWPSSFLPFRVVGMSGCRHFLLRWHEGCFTSNGRHQVATCAVACARRRLGLQCRRHPRWMESLDVMHQHHFVLHKMIKIQKNIL